MTRYTDIYTGNRILDQSLEDYLLHGYMPGGFLTAVLSNDLYLACGRADYWNRQRIADIAQEIFHRFPVDAIGSAERVEAWARDVGNQRTQYRDRIQKQYAMDILKGDRPMERDYHDRAPF